MEKLKKIYHFLSPKFQKVILEYPVDLKARYGWGRPPHKGLYEMINANRSSFVDLANRFLKYKDTFHQIKKRIERHKASSSWCEFDTRCKNETRTSKTKRINKGRK